MTETQQRLAAARERAVATAAAMNIPLDQYEAMLGQIVCTALREKLAELEAEAAERERGSLSAHMEPGDSGPA